MESVALTGSKFLGLSARQIPIYCAEGGFFQNVADISILYKIFGTRVDKQGGPQLALAKVGFM